MLQIFVNAKYDFIGKRRWFYLASLLSVVVALVSIAAHRGLNYGIDFTGGALIQVRYDRPATVGLVRQGLDDLKLGSAVIQQFGDAREYLIRLPETDAKTEELSARIKSALARHAGGVGEIRRM